MSAVYYESIITTTAEQLTVFHQIRDINKELTVSGDETRILTLLTSVDGLAAGVMDKVVNLLDSFKLVNLLSWLNMTFLLQHIITFIFTKKLGRFYSVGILHLTDLAMAISSYIFIDWYSVNILKDLYTDVNLSQD